MELFFLNPKHENVPSKSRRDYIQPRKILIHHYKLPVAFGHTFFLQQVEIDAGV
jgi:hypothetical protein